MDELKDLLARYGAGPPSPFERLFKQSPHAEEVYNWQKENLKVRKPSGEVLPFWTRPWSAFSTDFIQTPHVEDNRAFIFRTMFGMTALLHPKHLVRIDSGPRYELRVGPFDHPEGAWCVVKDLNTGARYVQDYADVKPHLVPGRVVSICHDEITVEARP